MNFKLGVATSIFIWPLLHMTIASMGNVGVQTDGFRTLQTYTIQNGVPDHLILCAPWKGSRMLKPNIEIVWQSQDIVISICVSFVLFSRKSSGQTFLFVWSLSRVISFCKCYTIQTIHIKLHAQCLIWYRMFRWNEHTRAFSLSSSPHSNNRMCINVVQRRRGTRS